MDPLARATGLGFRPGTSPESFIAVDRHRHPPARWLPPMGVRRTFAAQDDREGVGIGGVAVGGIEARRPRKANFRRLLLDPLQPSRSSSALGERHWRSRRARAQIGGRHRGSVDTALAAAATACSSARRARPDRGRGGAGSSRASATPRARSTALVDRHPPRPGPRRRAKRASSSRRQVDRARPARDGWAVRARRAAREVRAADRRPGARSHDRARGRSTSQPKVTTEELAAEVSGGHHRRPRALPPALFKNLQGSKTYRIAVGQAGLETPAGLYTMQDKADEPDLARAEQRLGGRPRRQGRSRRARTTRSRRAGWASTTAPASTARTRSTRSAPPPRTAASGWRSRTSMELYERVDVGTPVYIPSRRPRPALRSAQLLDRHLLPAALQQRGMVVAWRRARACR